MTILKDLLLYFVENVDTVAVFLAFETAFNAET